MLDPSNDYKQVYNMLMQLSSIWLAIIRFVCWSDVQLRVHNYKHIYSLISSTNRPYTDWYNSSQNTKIT